MSNRTGRNSNVVNSLVVIALLVCAGAGCKQLQKATEKVAEPSVLKSPDGNFQITVPGSWQKDLRSAVGADINAGSPTDGTFVQVIIEPKVDFTEETTLDTYTEIVRKAMIEKLTEPKSSSPVSVAINGLPGRRYQIQGERANIKIAYIVTTVETSEHYHQIVAWTSLSRMEQNREILENVTDSFRPTNIIPIGDPPK
jgi:hypothetical protein